MWDVKTASVPLAGVGRMKDLRGTRSLKFHRTGAHRNPFRLPFSGEVLLRG